MGFGRYKGFYGCSRIQYIDLIQELQIETFTHDDDGNLISRTADGKTTLYSFNGENRLINIEPETPQSGDIRVTMMYDYMGRRVEKKAFTHNGTAWTEDYTKHFLYDGWNLIKETTTENSTTTATYYTWGLDLSQSLQGAGGIGGLIATITDTDTNYHCYDLNGNKTQLLSEADGTINAHIEYDPFGNEITSYGLSPENDPFRFSTKYHDAEYDLYYYGYRYYVPDLGRWLTRDPIGEDGGINLYGFNINNAKSKIDPLGMFSHCHNCDEEQLKKLKLAEIKAYAGVKESISLLYNDFIVIPTQFHSYPNMKKYRGKVNKIYNQWQLNLLALLEKIYDGFKSNKYGVECECHCDPGVDAYTTGEKNWIRKLFDDDIHFCPAYFNSEDANYRADKFLHEMSHLFANTSDDYVGQRLWENSHLDAYWVENLATAPESFIIHFIKQLTSIWVPKE